MTSDQTIEIIKRHEGYRDSVYIDSKGVPTGGYGHAFLPGSFLPCYIWDRIFWYDHKIAIDDYEKLKFTLDTVRKAVIINMLFNLGLTKFLGFKKMIVAIRNRDYKTAAKEMLDSKWAVQVGKRAEELAQMMEDGSFP